MRRTERLFQIIQILRRSRGPVTGRALAEELEIAPRTLYRDMAELMAQRVPVRGEAGTGYVLDQGYDLPPLMLTADELEAALLGAAWVARRGDAALARSARDLVAKLGAVIPQDLRPLLLDDSLRPVSFAATPPSDALDMAPLRQAIRHRRKVDITYADGKGAISQRRIWPIFIAYMEEVRVVASWCELRSDFRHFRTDRIKALTLTDQPLPGRRAELLARWQAAMPPLPQRPRSDARQPEERGPHGAAD